MIYGLLVLLLALVIAGLFVRAVSPYLPNGGKFELRLANALSIAFMFVYCVAAAGQVPSAAEAAAWIALSIATLVFGAGYAVGVRRADKPAEPAPVSEFEWARAYGADPDSLAELRSLPRRELANQDYELLLSIYNRGGALGEGIAGVIHHDRAVGPDEAVWIGVYKAGADGSRRFVAFVGPRNTNQE